MKQYTAKVSGNWGFSSRAEREDVIEFEIEDDATLEEINKRAQELCWEWFCNYADCSAYDIELVNAPASDKAEK